MVVALLYDGVLVNLVRLFGLLGFWVLEFVGLCVLFTCLCLVLVILWFCLVGV